MLAYAYQTLNEVGYKNIQPDEFDNVHDLFAPILIRGVTLTILNGVTLRTTEIMLPIKC